MGSYVGEHNGDTLADAPEAWELELRDMLRDEKTEVVERYRDLLMEGRLDGNMYYSVKDGKECGCGYGLLYIAHKHFAPSFWDSEFFTHRKQALINAPIYNYFSLLERFLMYSPASTTTPELLRVVNDILAQRAP